MNEERILEIICDLADALEAASVNIKHRIAEITGVKEKAAVKEETFTILKFEKQTGSRLGEYEVAYKANNIEDKWTHAYNILRQNNATINNRYYGDSYAFAYWLYGKDKIYRQKLNAPKKANIETSEVSEHS
jgi:hypothetical protein